MAPPEAQELVPSTLLRKTYGASASSSIAEPACRSMTTSATTSTAASPNELPSPNRDSFQSYFAMLRSDADHEIEHLVNAFTVNETYFYREDHQLRCMTSHLLQAISCSARKPATQFEFGRYLARPAKSLIPLRCG